VRVIKKRAKAKKNFLGNLKKMSSKVQPSGGESEIGAEDYDETNVRTFRKHPVGTSGEHSGNIQWEYPGNV